MQDRQSLIVVAASPLPHIHAQLEGIPFDSSSLMLPTSVPSSSHLHCRLLDVQAKTSPFLLLLIIFPSCSNPVDDLQRPILSSFKMSLKFILPCCSTHLDHPATHPPFLGQRRDSSNKFYLTDDWFLLKHSSYSAFTFIKPFTCH